MKSWWRCICCTLRDDLLREVRALAESGRFDYLLIETTGISEPLPVAATFDFRSEHGESLSDVARLDTMLTVVDAMNLLKDYSSTDFLQDRGEALEGDRRTLVDLLVEQIEFADVVVLNKVDDASEEQRDAARKIIRSLNPEADIIEANHSRVPFDRVLDTGRFNFEKAQQHPLWYKELYGFAEHVPESEEYGVKNFVYRARRPFDPVKFDQFVKEPGPASSEPRGISGWRPDRSGSVRSARQAQSCAPKRWASGGRPFLSNVGLTILFGEKICVSTGTRFTATAARRSCLSGLVWTKHPSARGSMRVLCRAGPRWMSPNGQS
jgi:hypothetical protein